MRFSITTFLASLAALASANTVKFVSQDSTPRTIIFTAQAGWIGNFYSISDGAAAVPGMLGELRWDGWNGLHFFDVSAIVNKDDIHGVKTIYPKVSKKPSSGCQSYINGCAHAYYQPDDIQTKSTTESDLVCTVGTKETSADDVVERRHPRHFVTGHSQ